MGRELSAKWLQAEHTRGATRANRRRDTFTPETLNAVIGFRSERTMSEVWFPLLWLCLTPSNESALHDCVTVIWTSLRPHDIKIMLSKLNVENTHLASHYCTCFLSWAGTLWSQNRSSHLEFADNYVKIDIISFVTHHTWWPQKNEYRHLRFLTKNKFSRWVSISP